jgi:hypothetical protein
MSRTLTFEQFNDKHEGAAIVDHYGHWLGRFYESISCTGYTTDDYVWEVTIEDEDGDLIDTEVREVTVDGKTTLVEVEQ